MLDLAPRSLSVARVGRGRVRAGRRRACARTPPRRSRCSSWAWRPPARRPLRQELARLAGGAHLRLAEMGCRAVGSVGAGAGRHARGGRHRGADARAAHRRPRTTSSTAVLRPALERLFARIAAPEPARSDRRTVHSPAQRGINRRIRSSAAASGIDRSPPNTQGASLHADRPAVRPPSRDPRGTRDGHRRGVRWPSPPAPPTPVRATISADQAERPAGRAGPTTAATVQP